MADLSITATSVVPSVSNFYKVIAAEAIDAGETVCKDSAGELILTDATDSTKIDCVGIAVCSAAAGQPCMYVDLDPALVTDASPTNGAALLLSETPGKLTVTIADITTGSTPVSVGMGKGTTTMSFDAKTKHTGTEVA